MNLKGMEARKRNGEAQIVSLLRAEREAEAIEGLESTNNLKDGRINKSPSSESEKRNTSSTAYFQVSLPEGYKMYQIPRHSCNFEESVAFFLQKCFARLIFIFSG